MSFHRLRPYIFRKQYGLFNGKHSFLSQPYQILANKLFTTHEGISRSITEMTQVWQHYVTHLIKGFGRRSG